MRTVRKQSGVASILALLMLVILAALSTVFVSSANISLQQSNNGQRAHTAQASAENGMTMVLYWLRNSHVPYGKTGPAFLTDITTALNKTLSGQKVLNEGSVTLDDNTVTIKDAVLPGGLTFDAAITTKTQTSANLHVTVTGKAGNGNTEVTTRAIGLDLNVGTGTSTNGTNSSSFVLDYGIASKSAVELTGNATIRGANNASEANVISATSSTNQAFSLTGNCSLQGDLYASNPNATVSLAGNATIGGAGVNSAQLNSHIHTGTQAGEFPEVDPSVFSVFATNIVDRNTPTANKTFKNIRIKSGTNPTFSGNSTLQGVIFIEKGNKVTFSGNTSITGVIVTEDAGDNVYTTNTIKFSGNLTSRGVEELPDTSDFHTLRTMPGAFILAPGFGVQFTGNFGTVNGCMAADSYAFTGNAGGTIYGGVINYSDSKFTLTGNSSLIIDRLHAPAIPPGFKNADGSPVCAPAGFTADSDTYVEYGG